MVDEEEIRRRLEKASREAAEKATKELRQEVEALQQATAIDLERLKPQISDLKAYEKLIRAVEEATRRNESIAQLQDRVKKLGKKVVAVAKEAADLLT
jgi:hypothetical protein